MTTHAFSTSGHFTVSVTATDASGNASLPASLAPLAITTFTMEPDPLNSSQEAAYLGGTTGNDTVTVAATKMDTPGGTIYGVKVNMNNVLYGSFFSISRVVVYSQGGDDIMRTSPQDLGGGTLTYVTIPVMFFAGNGKDVLNGTGSAVGNVLVGGGGADRLFGGLGRDILIGGAGASTLQAGNPPATPPGQGGAILIGGTTDFDGKATALAALLAEWSSSNDYATRIAHLTGTMGGGLNGTYLLKASTTHSSTDTVHDNGLIDKLSGGTGTDWFFEGMMDVFFNITPTPDETVTTIS
jgi:Ca2+-binding RTX toxin-like protein